MKSVQDAANRVYAATDELNAAMRALPHGYEVQYDTIHIGTMESPKAFTFRVVIKKEVERDAP